MKKINPLYFLALLVTILLISISQQNSSNEELKDTYRSFEELKIKSNIYKEFKVAWLDKKSVQKRVDKIKNNPLFRNEKIKVDSFNNSIKITFESTNRRKQNNFINMILNDSLIIKSMNFNKKILVVEVSVK